MNTRLAPLALSMGEAAGIGAEITVRAWHARRHENVNPFIYVGAPQLLHDAARSLDLPVDIRETGCMTEAADAWDTLLPVLPVELQAPVLPGAANEENAGATLEAIGKAVDLVQTGHAAGLVTNPIHKATLYSAGFLHPGHTEYLAELSGAANAPVMMLVVDDFRTVPITVHMPLTTAIASLSSDLIFATGQTVAEGLKRYFGIAEPRLTVAGLNPHAGEQGTLGAEETDIIEPALDLLRQAGIAVSGPASADTLFHETARRKYDAALCMYHDQALIPIKTIGFEDGVNCTLGLPFIRTSPDHGTAFDIAGLGVASPRSLIAALNLAGSMARNASSQ